MTSVFSFRTRWPVLLAMVFGTCGAGCDPKEKDLPGPPAADERELLAPDVKKRKSLSRCKAVSEAQTVTLRADSSKKAPKAVEVGNAVPTTNGFALGVLRTVGDTTAEIAQLDGRGRMRKVELGRVHGSVDPPFVFAVGQDVYANVLDNDAGHTRLRLAKVARVEEAPAVIWGPEVQVRRGETQTSGLAVLRSEGDKAPSSGLLVWDDFDKSTLRSSIRALSFDPKTMKSVGTERSVSPPDEDAESPLVVATSGGSRAYWIVWLAYSEAGNQKNDRLVDEPPRSLRVARLDQDGKATGAPLTVSAAGENVLVIDAAAGPDGTLALAYRAAETGRDEGATPIRLRIVSSDGSVTSQSVGHEELGLGAPQLLVDQSGSPLWVSALGQENESLLGVLDASGVARDFELESGLTGRIPLSRAKDTLLVMEPDGLDLRLSVLRCGM